MLTRPTLARVLLAVAAATVAAIGCGLSAILSSGITSAVPIEIPARIYDAPMVCYVISGGILAALSVQFLTEHHIWRGVPHAWHHWRITHRVKHQLKDAGYGIQRRYTVELPRVKLELMPGCTSGTLRIQNAVKFDSKLDNVGISSALRHLVVETQYQSDNANWYVYEIVSGEANYKLTFDSVAGFFDYVHETPDYRLFFDARTTAKLQHTLLVGATGSGKTYATYSLILQMAARPDLYTPWFADPKGSSLAIMGERIALDRTAVELHAIVDLLGRFVSAMNERKSELKEKLRDKLDADYSDFGMAANVLIFDEYASFAGSLATLDKQQRDNAKQWVREIVLQGRQLGFFIVIAMQKSDSTLIDTAIRDSLTLKIVLGNAEDTTYITAFGNGVDIPNRNYGLGDGVFTEPTLAPKPKLIQFPVLDFKIQDAIS